MAKKQEEWQAEKRAAATMKYTKREKEEQFRCVKDEGAFRTQAGKDAMIKRFKAVVDRHRKREQSRNRILLGTEPYSDKFKSKCYDEHVASIRENCSEDVSGNMFRALIENYHDEDSILPPEDRSIGCIWICWDHSNAQSNAGWHWKWVE